MNFEHMRRMCGWHFTVRGQAALADYEFGFDLRGYNAIRQKIGSKVFGVLYKIDEECLGIMDDYEGYPNVFDRTEVLVNDGENNSFKAWVYLEKPDNFGGKEIKEQHLQMIITGAKTNRLPQEWINFLQSFQNSVKK
jgi:gamma-glutamylcyclotransferase (GGCT)/AIG2-like uncharacterized protein YtfP